MDGREDMKEENKELSHDPVPGYRPAFYVIFGLSLLYIAIIFIFSITG